MTKQKQVVFTSPLLVRSSDGEYLLKASSGAFALCMDALSALVDVPESDAYEVEISTTQWGDDSGCSVWLTSDVTYGLRWSLTRRLWLRKFDTAAVRFIERHLTLPENIPTRCFFRLLYD